MYIGEDNCIFMCALVMFNASMIKCMLLDFINKLVLLLYNIRYGNMKMYDLLCILLINYVLRCHTVQVITYHSNSNEFKH